MSDLVVDHIAVVARTLKEGYEYVKDNLGVNVQFGGRHPQMGTHNCLAKLGEDEFLEVIAIDPNADSPNRPRWFNLDLHGNKAPYLAHWIARTSDMAETLPQITAPVGAPINCLRDQLRWQLTIPEDGSFAFDGAFPSIIEWPMRPFPGASMAEVGCQLESLTLSHPKAEELNAAFKAVLQDKRIVVEQADQVSLKAAINTPSGLRYL